MVFIFRAVRGVCVVPFLFGILGSMGNSIVSVPYYCFFSINFSVNQSVLNSESRETL